jgi:hypothetical protein
MRKQSAAVLAAILFGTPVANAVAATTVTGELTLKLTVTIASTIPTSTEILCGLSADVSGESTSGQFDSIQEYDTVVATRSGATAACQLAIPYQWILYGTGDTVSLSYSVTALNGTSVGRSNSVSFETIAVPKNGATTSYSLTGRI